ncbi:hypothetical protein KR76_00166 [Pimelobacter simplex]|uniref:Uncharacterized protein n=1 Tax=Nocardioides simplex TaxID=2045 RepID=A0A0C5XI87_NOCSI|nr:hypothetical protein KR76_00166 [Pimelobacter simplex]
MRGLRARSAWVAGPRCRGRCRVNHLAPATGLLRTRNRRTSRGRITQQRWGVG